VQEPSWHSIRLKSPPGKDDPVITNSSIEGETRRVMGLLSRALNVFGGDVDPADPPRFAAAADIEDDLGRGHF
jgi:hypothetical protein